MGKHKIDYSERKTRSKAVNDVVKKSIGKLQDPDFIRKVADKFIQAKIDQFPKICALTRKDNMMKRKEHEAIGNAGGWSEKKNFKFDFSIPVELFHFMINLVARDFWDEHNEKTWRWFMNEIMKGEDSTSLLYRVKQRFEGNEQSGKLKVK